MGRLIALSGPLAGQRFDVDEQVVIGRAGVDIVVDDAELSRRHASVRPLQGGALVEDLGSTNGTFIDGERITGPAVLADGQRLQIGGSEFAYESQSSGATELRRSPGQDSPSVPTPAPAPPAPVTPAYVGQPDPAAGGGSPAYGPGAAQQSAAAGYALSDPGPRPAPPKQSRMPLVLMTLVALVAAAAAVYFATHTTKSSASTDNQALNAAGANAAFQKSEVSPRIDKINTACVPDDNGHMGAGHFRFITSACENSTSTVATLPLHRGTSGGHTVYYVITDASTQAEAKSLGVNFVPKLKNAIGSTAVEKVTMSSSGTIDFPATVDFKEKHVLVAGPNGFPPSRFSPPAVGAAHYSPLIELPNGTVLNAPQIANSTGQAIKVVKLNTSTMKVTYVETEGRYEGKHVHYASFDSSSPLAASIENMTYAPALGAVPKEGDEGLNSSARETLMAFVNGPTGPNQPQRQGINSAIVDHLDPHNILHEVPTIAGHADVGDDTYAPMWDVHLIQWTPMAIAAGDRIELRSLFEVQNYVSHGAFACGQGTQQCSQGLVQGVGGKILTPSNFVAKGATGFIVNCPVISIDLP